MLLVQCMRDGRRDGPSWNRGVNFASIVHLHLPKTSDEGVCESAAVCMWCVGFFIPTTRAVSVLYFVFLVKNCDGELLKIERHTEPEKGSPSQ